MQRMIAFGFVLDLAADLAAFCTDASATSLVTTLALSIVPAAFGLCQFVNRAIADGDDVAEFRVEPIRR
jgi:hypothetical protein